MPKYALLVGCNYPGTNAALNGCINDVWGTKKMLQEFYGFQENEITVMIDTDPQYTKPTGANIKKKLSEIVAAAQDGDVIFFHFSGHGTQVPSDDPEETDGKDEAICPCDMNVITDDDLRGLISPLGQKPGVKFTFLADCCHSGTLLDHREIVITGPKAGGPPPPAVDVQAIQGMLAALGAGGKREVKNRSLPFDDLLGFLTNLLGQPVTRGNVRDSMTSIFGADASLNAQNFVKYGRMAQQALAALNTTGGNAEKSVGGFGSMLTSVLGVCIGIAESAVNTTGTAAQGAHATGTAPAKPPPSGKLREDIGILITGCQDKETSADACPSGDKAQAHGALSNALHTVVRNHHAQYPGQALTYRNLVLAVRDALAKAGFAQNPCLECHETFADTTFVTH